jgi:hypothetical protein
MPTRRGDWQTEHKQAHKQDSIGLAFDAYRVLWTKISRLACLWGLGFTASWTIVWLDFPPMARVLPRLV